SKSVQKKVFTRIGQPAPRVTELRPELPAALADVVAKMMAIEPADRFASPIEVADALTRFTGEPISSSITLPPLLPPAPMDDQSTADFFPSIGARKQVAPAATKSWLRRIAVVAGTLIGLAALGAALGMMLAR